MIMEIDLCGGLAVEARWEGFRVRADQPPERGGEGSAPSPFDLFLASLGTCAGYFVTRFCAERGIETAGLGLTLRTEAGEGEKKLGRVLLELHLPEGFPDRYRRAVVRAMDQCTVKRSLADPPEVLSVLA